jgi:hypothetical protein
MYTARKTEIGKLRTFERELTTHYGEAVLRKHWDDAQAIWNKRRDLRRAILQHEEWNVDSTAVDNGEIVELPAISSREEEVAEELALVG